MANQYDFNPRTTPLSGLSLTDLVNAKQTPITTAALATPPIFEALRRRAAYQQQMNAINAFAQSQIPGQESQFNNPDMTRQLLQSGLVDLPGFANLQEKIAETGRKKLVDAATIRFKNAQAQQLEDASKSGGVVSWIQGPDGNLYPHYVQLPPGANKGNTISAPPPPKEGDPVKQAIANMINGKGNAGQVVNQIQQQAPAPAAAPIATPAPSANSNQVMVQEIDRTGKVLQEVAVPKDKLPLVKQAFQKNGNRMKLK